MPARPKLLFLVTEDRYFCSHRLPLGVAAVREGYDVLVATRVGEHARPIEAAGIGLRPLEITRGGHNPLREAAVVREIARIYREERPDLVHHVALKPVIYGSLAATVAPVPGIVNALTGLGYVFTSSTIKARCLRPIVAMALRGLLRQRNSCLILQNPDDAALIEKILKGHRPRSALIRGSGVDLSAFSFSPEPDQTPLVCLPARMLWDKGVGEFVGAARLLRARGMRARFALVGALDDQNPAGIPERILREWRDEGAVEWWGHRDDMPTVYRESNLVCLPSYREGLPKALIEAAACGRAIVTTDAPGCREVVREGENGLLVPVKEEAGLAEAIARLLADPAARGRMGRRGREIASAEFSQEQVVERTLELYREILAGSRPGK